MAPTYKLYYFNYLGRAETARLLFIEAGVEFQDIRIPLTEWPKVKHNFVTGKLPCLEVDGRRLYESQAINRYLAAEFGLLGRDDWEAAKADMLADSMNDIWSDKRVLAYYVEKDKEKKEEMWDDMHKHVLEPYLQKLEKLLRENGGDLFVGNQLTWADVLLYIQLDYWHHSKFPGLLNEYIALRNYPQRFLETHPRIREYVQKHRPTQKMSMFD